MRASVASSVNKLPALSKANRLGVKNPAALPRPFEVSLLPLPANVKTSPADIFLMLPLKASATYTVPSGETAISNGLLNDADETDPSIYPGLPLPASVVTVIFWGLVCSFISYFLQLVITTVNSICTMRMFLFIFLLFQTKNHSP